MAGMKPAVGGAFLVHLAERRSIPDFGTKKHVNIPNSARKKHRNNPNFTTNRFLLENLVPDN
jgi:hypothetical protein